MRLSAAVFSFAATLLLFLSGPSRALAASTYALDGSGHPGPGALRPGERFVQLPSGSGVETLSIAGRTVELNGASALIGSSSDAVFIAVASGEARTGGLGAGPGEALMFQPYGQEPSVVDFDAERMAAMFGPRPPNVLQPFVSALMSVADDQSLGIFLGMYQRSLFDLQTPGGSRVEGGRASVMGAPEVARIRYSGASNPDQIEEMVVARAAAALSYRDANTLAQLLDPTPFGGDDLNGGGQEARLVVARQLIADFSGVASGDVRRGAGEGVWRAGSVTMRTRPFSDFIFISSVE